MGILKALKWELEGLGAFSFSPSLHFKAMSAEDVFYIFHYSEHWVNSSWTHYVDFQLENNEAFSKYFYQKTWKRELFRQDFYREQL